MSKNIQFLQLHNILENSQKALLNASDDQQLRKYLYQQRSSLRTIRIWLLEQQQSAVGKTYTTATELHGAELQQACLGHLEEAKDLLMQIEQWNPQMTGEKIKINIGLVSVRTFLFLKWNAFQFRASKTTSAT